MSEKQYYPQIHFAPKYGWINDPNGLVYHDGIYELYFQHNPDGIEWGNMTWGHARSKDLVHWEEMEPVLRPDENGFMYSGCGLRNDNRLLELAEDDLIYFYTAAKIDWTNPSKTRFTIRRAYSCDGGTTLIKTGEPVLESLYPENRDPKVFWHEESEAYILVLWLHKNDFGIFRSGDLKHFELTQQLTLPGGYECPDLFRLPVYDPDTGEQRGFQWVFWTADGSYYPGDFDGYAFSMTQPCQKANAMNSLPYAAQTFSGTDEVISMSWLCTKCIGLRTTGAISLPRALSLIKKEGRYLLRQMLPKMVEDAFVEAGEAVHAQGYVDLKEEYAIRLLVHCEGNWTIAFCSAQGDTELQLSYRYAGGSFIATHKDVSDFVMLGGPASEFEIIYDRGILEISSGDGSLLAISDIPELRTKCVTGIRILEGTARITVMYMK